MGEANIQHDRPIKLPETPGNPEEHENFRGNNVLVIGGPDAHGVSMAVVSAQYLETKGAKATIFVGSPVIREGKGATHPGAFYTKTLPELDVEGYDRVVVADIPLDFSRQLEQSEDELIKLSDRLHANRQKRGLPQIEHSVLYLDHHQTTQFQKDSPSVLVKWVPKAEECRLGAEPSKIARIGAICDRDASALPVQNEEEMMLSKGLDAAVRPSEEAPALRDFLKPEEFQKYKDRSDQWLSGLMERVKEKPGLTYAEYVELYKQYTVESAKPTVEEYAGQDETHAYQEAVAKWEEEAQARLNKAAEQLNAEDWEYFRQEAERLNRMEMPTTSGFGDIGFVDTQDLTGKFAVYKLMEMAIENAGVDEVPYAIGVLRAVDDKKMGREPADVISVIRYWTREDLPSVKDVIVEHLGQEFIDKYKVYGAVNAQSVRLPVNDRETAQIVAKLIESFAGREMPDFSQIRSVVMCGDPNSGKSVYSTIFREALKELGVKVVHLDLDKAAPTPSWYLDAEIGYKNAEGLFAQGRITQEQLTEAKKALEDASERRRSMKRPWSIDLAEEAKQELLAASESRENDFVIGDIGGGRIKKDENGKTIKITRLTAENARILEGTDAVIIVSNNPAGAAEWRRLIEMGIDPETGVRINRDKPIQIIGVYQSVLEGSTQKVAGTRDEAGVVTNLDRSKAERKYNPSIFASAVFISEAVEKRRQNNE